MYDLLVIIRESSAVQVKTKGARKITFAQFVDALALIADKRSTTLCEAAQIVVAANGPAVSGTKADYVKFHDDKACPAIPLQFHSRSCLLDCIMQPCNAKPSPTSCCQVSVCLRSMNSIRCMSHGVRTPW